MSREHFRLRVDTYRRGGSRDWCLHGLLWLLEIFVRPDCTRQILERARNLLDCIRHAHIDGIAIRIPVRLPHGQEASQSLGGGIDTA